MSRSLLYIELTLASLCAALFVLTLAWPEWIEEIFGVDPDGGNGAVEWAIVAALAISTIVLSASARRERRRLKAAHT